VPDTVAGLTVLAAGSSVPEIVSSIIVCRKGKGEMAISNSLGSNVFDILICLGFPWFIETVIIRPKQNLRLYSGGLFYATIILLSSLCLLMISFIVYRWRLNKKFGAAMLIFWTIAIVLMCLFEYDVFGNFSIPECK
jgi:solute carrier family 24 (sodium/potassium/calcium exchanger), member 4